MPADDLVLNVRQIAGYTPAWSALGSDQLVLQRGGLGGPYISISAENFVTTALAQGGDMAIGGDLTAVSFQGGSAQFSNAAVNLFSAQKASIVNLAMTFGTIGGSPIATLANVADTVTSFEGRTGAVTLWINDILRAGGAPNFSPAFGGCPRAPTPEAESNSSRLATTAFVQRNSVLYIENLLTCHPFVFTFNGRSGDVVLTSQDIINAGGTGEIFDNVILTGIPTAPTAPVGTNTDQIATCAFVNAEIQAALAQFAGIYAPLASPQFTGFPSGPTAPPGSSTGQLATTAFVMAAVAASTAGVATFNGRTGTVVLTAADLTGVGGALLVSPAFTGTPTGPTAAPGTSTGQLATTAFVNAAIGGVGVETFNGRAGAVTLTTADITGAGGAPIASPIFTGNPTAPTPAPGDSDTSIATTAYVMNALATGGVTSFNTRTGAITLLASDISAAGGATLASPVFTGIPVAPTAAPTVTTNQLATCAFVANAIAGSVSSFNGRSGAVTLTAADISAAGGAPLTSPHFNGGPTAPTATAGDNSTAIATTAFVDAAIGASAGVTTFNGRAGAVTLTTADISAAGGAPIISPALTGIPTAPTAAASTSTTQLATTAFVMNAISLGGGVLSFNGRAGSVTLTLADVTTAFPASAALPLMNGSAAPGSSAAWSAGDHIHPVDTSRYAASNPSGFQTAAQVNAATATKLALTGGTLTGNLVVNTASTPTVAFYLSGTSYGSVSIDNATGQLRLGSSQGGFAYIGASIAGTIITNAVPYSVSGGPWLSSSDARIKTVEGDYAIGLDEVLALRPVTYRFKGNDTDDAVSARGSAPFDDSLHALVAKQGKSFVGLVAQEVEAVFPGMVIKRHGFIDGVGVSDFRDLDTGPLIYALVNAVKNLAARLAALEEA